MRTVRILHGSDFHGSLPEIHEEHLRADFLVLTGDLAPHNIDNFEFSSGGYGGGYRRHVIADLESKFQGDWIESDLKPWISRTMARNVISVPGNHDFFKSSDHFQHTVNKGAKVIKLDGVRFGLLTGIPTMIGEWVDEIMDFEFKERIRKIPWNIQVLLTHAGPYGVLDNAPFDGLYDHLGFQSYQQAVFGLRMAKIEPKFKRLKAILFGHCHEANAIQDTDVDGRRLVISNAACGIRSIELKIP